MVTPFFERGLTRREFLKSAALFGGAVLFSQAVPGCETPEEALAPSQKSKELGNIPRDGDIVVVGGEPFLFRNNKRYLIPDLRIYTRNTKLERYGRKTLYLPQGSPQDRSIGDVPRAKRLFDKTTNTEKTINPFGQEILVFFPGFLTDGGMPWETIRPASDTFVSLLVGLKPKKWGLAESFFFTYGKERLIEYEAKHVARSPEENMQYAIDFLSTLKKEFPLAQFNIICHSLGGLFGLAAAKKHFDAVNNLILINSPIRGIEGNLFRRGLFGSGRKLLEPYIGEEKVSEYLFNAWDSKNYQKELEEFGLFFASIGRQIIVVVDENDQFVPAESSMVKGAKEIRFPKTTNAPIPINEWLVAHGRPLRDKGMVGQIGDALGENLAAAE